MARWLARIAAVLFGVALVPVPVHAQAQVQGWHTDLNAAREVARRTGKPLFVVFRCVR
ncbi:MAG TPA: hypothetical protein VHB77_09950 [Planctomycetaceae bacterium]|nr:hypothetical protein [Planctomycetaceae bacterium]